MVAAKARAGERSRETLVALGRHTIEEVASARLDYFELVDGDTLVARDPIAAPTRAVVAAFVGKTRLIDNLPVL